MLAEARMKLRNAESSIAFLQTQHAEILQGLHAEIQTLQQKCARKLHDAISLTVIQRIAVTYKTSIICTLINRSDI